MTRIIMRSPRTPFRRSNHEKAIVHDQVSTNAGNLLFPYAISRALMLPGVEIDYVKSCPKLAEDDETADEEPYDYFIIPLANAFRRSFARQLDRLSNYIESVDIPCIVVGVGLQADMSADFSASRPFDDNVKRFMKAVLEKSACVGVRGEATGVYLQSLGFTPERDFTVIGCPSMYLHGADLPRPRALDLSPRSRVSLNCKVNLPKEIHRYMGQTTQLIPDWHYVVQNTYELKSIYYGLNVRETYSPDAKLQVPEGYPTGGDNPAVRAGRVLGFVDVPSWLSFLQGKDLSFGTRIHGNIAGVLSGAPTYIVAPDSRVFELAEYHRIPHMSLKDLDESRDIFHLLENVDFDAVREGHAERFAHYLDFLHRNGLKTIFDDDYASAGKPPFDRMVEKVRPSGPVTMNSNPAFRDDSGNRSISSVGRKAVKALMRKMGRA